MYNANRPKLSELPSPASLLRSTLIAAASAAAILVAVVLPSEYGIDPTGAGRMLGLNDMGQTKLRLAAEAEADRVAAEAAAALSPGLEGLYQRIDALELAVRDLTRTVQAAQAATVTIPADVQIDAHAQNVAPSPVATQPAATDPAASVEPASSKMAAVSVGVEEAAASVDAPAETVAAQPKRDSASFSLRPGQGIEIKLVMKKGAKANYAWSTEGGPVNFDTHGDGTGDLKISYEKGRGVQSDEGTLIAEFDGNHGWFWRNRGQEPVTLTLRTAGYYSAIKGIPN